MNRKFIASKSGKKVFIAASATTVGLFLANYVPHTFGIEQYRKFLQCYKNAEPVPISTKLQERFNKAIKVCDMESSEQNIVVPFTVVGFDVKIAGSTKSRFGAIVGVPSNFEYSSTNDIKRNEIRFRDQVIDWNSKSGKLLEESLVLTEDEQMFGFCKGLLQVKTHYVLKNAIFPSLSFLSVYSIGNYLNASLGLLAKPFAVRLIMYGILGLFGLGSWCFMKDYNQVTCDADVDQQIAAMGPQFIQAGISYYDKQLKKNMALRDLLKDDTFTAKGNFNYILRQQSLPLTLRKSFFESKMEDFTKSAVQT